MVESSTEMAAQPQAIVSGDLADDGMLNGRAGNSEFSVGGPDGRGGTAPGANPYDLLSASLAACTAMTIRLQARRKEYALSHVEVAVSFHHRADGGRDSFERAITLQGVLNDQERTQLMEYANLCPVGRTLGLSADIHTRPADAQRQTAGGPANYNDDLSELPIPYIDAD